MQVYRGFHHPGIARACALTIGNFDGVHRGHQAMLALLHNEARHRGLPSCVLTFEPHPRDHFARVAGKPQLAPARIASLRDKLSELERVGVDQVVVLRFDTRFASLSPQSFIDDVLVRGLGARYVLVGDDFRFGAKRAGDYAMLDAAGQQAGFDVARMMSYEVHGLRVSSSAVREALAAGDMASVATLLGRPYSISGHVMHGRKLGREQIMDALWPDLDLETAASRLDRAVYSLRQLFEPYGVVDEIRVIIDRDTGRSKGFGFVEMPDSTAAKDAIAGLQGKELAGRTLTVNEAKPREPRREPSRSRW